ncbi:glycosyltransferase family 4 protein [Virgibacillus sp. FSP13]
MKCLIVTTLDRQVSLFLLPHIDLLRGMGYQVSVATSLANQSQLEERHPAVDFRHIPFSRSIRSPLNIRAFRKIRKLMLQEKFDFVHVHTPIAAFITRLAAPKRQKMIYTAHGFHFNENGSTLTNRLFYFAEKIAARKTDQLIVMNEEDYQKATEFMSLDKIHHIHGIGVDSAYFNKDYSTEAETAQRKEMLGIPKNHKVITHIAEFNENKRQIDVVQATEQLKEVYKDFVILLVGDGVLSDEIKRELKDRELGAYVRCLGFREDIRDILSVTDIGLLVSLREGLPKSLMEMKAMQMPIIVTDIRGNRELVEDGRNGFIVPVKSPKKLMHALHTLLEDEKLCREMGRNGRREVVMKYDVQLILKQTKKVYQGINAAKSDLVKGEEMGVMERSQ